MPGRPSSCQALPWGSRLRPPLRSRQLASPLLHSRMASTSYSVERNPYSVLGVAPGVCENTLKAAFRQRALLYHPDRNPPCHREEAEQAFKDINEAYERLLCTCKQDGRGRRQWERDRLYSAAYPSMFFDVFGVRRDALEGTATHILPEPRGCEHAGASQAAFCGSRGERND